MTEETNYHAITPPTVGEMQRIGRMFRTGRNEAAMNASIRAALTPPERRWLKLPDDEEGTPIKEVKLEALTPVPIAEVLGQINDDGSVAERPIPPTIISMDIEHVQGVQDLCRRDLDDSEKFTLVYIGQTAKTMNRVIDKDLFVQHLLEANDSTEHEDQRMLIEDRNRINQVLAELMPETPSAGLDKLQAMPDISKMFKHSFENDRANIAMRLAEETESRDNNFRRFNNSRLSCLGHNLALLRLNDPNFMAQTAVRGRDTILKAFEDPFWQFIKIHQDILYFTTLDDITLRECNPALDRDYTVNFGQILFKLKLNNALDVLTCARLRNNFAYSNFYPFTSSGGSWCWGSAYTIIDDAMLLRNYAPLFSNLKTLLTVYQADGPYTSLIGFKERLESGDRGARRLSTQANGVAFSEVANLNDRISAAKWDIATELKKGQWVRVMPSAVDRGVSNTTVGAIGIVTSIDINYFASDETIEADVTHRYAITTIARPHTGATPLAPREPVVTYNSVALSRCNLEPVNLIESTDPVAVKIKEIRDICHSKLLPFYGEEVICNTDRTAWLGSGYETKNSRGTIRNIPDLSSRIESNRVGVISRVRADLVQDNALIHRDMKLALTEIQPHRTQFWTEAKIAEYLEKHNIADVRTITPTAGA